MIIHPTTMQQHVRFSISKRGDKKGKPIAQDCSCHSDNAGLAHMSCIIQYATQKCKEAMLLDLDGLVAPWGKCPNYLLCM